MFKKITALCTAILISSAMTLTVFAKEEKPKAADSSTVAIPKDYANKTTSLDSSSQMESESQDESSHTKDDESSSTSDNKLNVNSMITQYLKNNNLSSVMESDSNNASGNASLISEKKIIHDSAEMQFIAVTTRSGAVFYILIDYTAIQEGNVENSVYFLNKVDDYDLYQIISQASSDDSESNTLSPEEYEEQKKQAESTAEETSKANAKTKSSDSNLPFVLICLGVSVVFILVIFVIKKGKKGKSSDVIDDELDFGDDEENNDNDNMD